MSVSKNGGTGKPIKRNAPAYLVPIIYQIANLECPYHLSMIIDPPNSLQQIVVTRP